MPAEGNAAQERGPAGEVQQAIDAAGGFRLADQEGGRGEGVAHGAVQRMVAGHVEVQPVAKGLVAVREGASGQRCLAMRSVQIQGAVQAGTAGLRKAESNAALWAAKGMAGSASASMAGRMRAGDGALPATMAVVMWWTAEASGGIGISGSTREW